VYDGTDELAAGVWRTYSETVMSHPPVPLGVRACLLYNRLFSWRFRDRAEAHKLLQTDPARFREGYFDYEFGKPAQLMAKFDGFSVEGKTVLDFGCLNGGSTLWYASHGAKHVIGVDINREAIAEARRIISSKSKPPDSPIELRVAGDQRIPVEDESVDLVISEDVVEHLKNPDATFQEWNRVLVPGGHVLISFGPLWYHPHGVHLWEVFPGPWNHVIFPERTVISALCLLKNREQRDVSYVDLGMNKMTLGRFERAVEGSGLKCLRIHRHAAWRLSPLLRVPLLREFFASQVDSILQKPAA